MNDHAPLDRYAVLGHPVAHSRSPAIHAAFAAQTGQRLDYGRLECPLDGFADAVRRFAAEGARGCNVTVPFKFEALALAARSTERATLAGAANTLRFDAEGWLADNTDGVGLVRDIELGAGRPLAGRRVLLIGAGGAGAGVLGPLLQARPAADSATPCARAQSPCRSTSDWAFAGVRLATTMDAGRGAACADEQHTQPLQRHAGIALQVAHQADAVAVVGEPAVGVEAQQVGRFGQRRARRHCLGQCAGLELEGHGDVAAARARFGKGVHRLDEAVHRAQHAGVFQVLAGLAGELGMDERRLAVRDRVAEDRVTIGGLAHWVALLRVVSRPSSRVKRKREVMTIWSACLRMAALKGPKGAAARTMARARWSSSFSLDGRTISASTT
jgi:hypothetical protein